MEEKIEQQPNNPFSLAVPKLDDFKKDASPFSGIETRFEKTTPVAEGIPSKFEKKSRRNKGKRAGVQYVVTSATRVDELDADEDEESISRAPESHRSNYREDTQENEHVKTHEAKVKPSKDTREEAKEPI